MLRLVADPARSGSPLRRALPLLLLLWTMAAPRADALDEARKSSGVERVHTELGLTGAGVLVAIIDRGLDYTHPGFRTESGSTRLEAIFDLTDDGGAKVPSKEFMIFIMITKSSFYVIPNQKIFLR